MSSPTPTKAAGATSVATEFKPKVPSITGITPVTEALGSNKLLGGPSSTRFVGAFANAADAAARSEYILVY